MRNLKLVMALTAIFLFLFHLIDNQMILASPSHQTTILESLFKNRTECYFIQIGSHEGNSPNDPLFSLVNKYSWRGVLVEPIPYLFEKLKKNYSNCKRVFFEDVAIADSRKIVDFYYIEKHSLQNMPWWSDQLGSLDRSHISNHVQNAPIKNIKVQCVTINDLIEKYKIAHLDLLHIDTEGNDIAIIRSIDFSKITPSVILFEHAHSDGTQTVGEKYTQCCAYLKEKGYSILYKDEMDTLVVHANHYSR